MLVFQSPPQENHIVLTNTLTVDSTSNPKTTHNIASYKLEDELWCDDMNISMTAVDLALDLYPASTGRHGPIPELS